MESKELPDDVLSIIRAYSRPAFVHFREYNQALKLFSLPLDYKERLKKKIDDPDVRRQIKICVEAEAEYHTNNANYLAKKTHENEYIKDKSHWWASVSKDKFVALVDEEEYRMQGYAEWYFQDDINDAWMDSDSESDDSGRREEDLARQEEWMYGPENQSEASDSD
jgi:hypothetical protein